MFAVYNMVFGGADLRFHDTISVWSKVRRNREKSGALNMHATKIASSPVRSAGGILRQSRLAESQERLAARQIPQDGCQTRKSGFVVSSPAGRGAPPIPASCGMQSKRGPQKTEMQSWRLTTLGEHERRLLEAPTQPPTSVRSASFSGTSAHGASSLSASPRPTSITIVRSHWAARTIAETSDFYTRVATSKKVRATPYNMGCSTACSAGDVALPYMECN